MLQSKAGYIDARPLTASSAKSTCNARPDHTSGSKAEKLEASKCFLLFPQQRTSRPLMSACADGSPCSFRPPKGVFPLKKVNFLPMNQAHRSAPNAAQRIDHPPPQRSRASVERAMVVQRDAASEFVN